MKVSSAKPPSFTPVELTITFESQKEMEAFYCVFNHTYSCSFLRTYGVRPEAIREAVLGDSSYASPLWPEYSRITL